MHLSNTCLPRTQLACQRSEHGVCSGSPAFQKLWLLDPEISCGKFHDLHKYVGVYNIILPFPCHPPATIYLYIRCYRPHHKSWHPVAGTNVLKTSRTRVTIFFRKVYSGQPIDKYTEAIKRRWGERYILCQSCSLQSFFEGVSRQCIQALYLNRLSVSTTDI
jgi:hypothetical protein